MDVAADYQSLLMQQLRFILGQAGSIGQAADIFVQRHLPKVVNEINDQINRGSLDSASNRICTLMWLDINFNEGRYLKGNFKPFLETVERIAEKENLVRPGHRPSDQFSYAVTILSKLSELTKNKPLFSLLRDLDCIKSIKRIDQILASKGLAPEENVRQTMIRHQPGLRPYLLNR